MRCSLAGACLAKCKVEPLQNLKLSLLWDRDIESSGVGRKLPEKPVATSLAVSGRRASKYVPSRESLNYRVADSNGDDVPDRGQASNSTSFGNILRLIITVGLVFGTVFRMLTIINGCWNCFGLPGESLSCGKACIVMPTNRPCQRPAAACNNVVAAALSLHRQAAGLPQPNHPAFASLLSLDILVVL